MPQNTGELKITLKSPYRKVLIKNWSIIIILVNIKS